jgi:SAM-dependent methyltransferase
MERVRRWVKLEGVRILDAGCGVGMYSERFLAFSPQVTGVEIEHSVAVQAHSRHVEVALCPAERLPFADGSFDVVFSHEVLEHVCDDREAAREMVRVVRQGGRIVLFCPNRLYPFETHGHYWRGRYHFGNSPLINWLPDSLRNRLAPHVRAYTKRSLLALFAGQPVRVVHHTAVAPALDNVAARNPQLGRVAQSAMRVLERTPLRWFGLSHFLVLERTS